MNRGILIVLFSFLISIALFAQIRTESLNLAKDEEIIEILNVGKDGFIIETVNTEMYKFNLRFYSSELILEWETPLDMSSPVFKTSVSKLSHYVYLSNQTLQLDLKNKTMKRFDMSELPPGRMFRSYFQDNKFWYGLYYVKFNDTYLMRRVEHANTKLKDLVFQLPKGPDYLYSTEWYYLANDNSNNIYVYDKTAGYQHMGHLQNNKLNYEIINLNTNMNIKNRINIDIFLDSIYVCPSLNFKKDHEFPSPATDFDLKTINMKDLWIPKPEAYSSIFYEPQTKSFYIYGLWGNDPFYETNNKSLAKGYFIFRYNEKGELVNKTISKLPNDTAIFGGYDARTLISFTQDNKLLFQIYFDRIINKLKVRGTVYSFVYYGNQLFSQYVNNIQSDRKKYTDPMTYDYVTENIQHFDFILTSSNFTGPVKFYNALNTRQQRENIYRLFRYDNNNVLVEEDAASKLINLFLFIK